jgi:hypothetical protein
MASLLKTSEEKLRHWLSPFPPKKKCSLQKKHDHDDADHIHLKCNWWPNFVSQKIWLLNFYLSYKWILLTLNATVSCCLLALTKPCFLITSKPSSHIYLQHKMSPRGMCIYIAGGVQGGYLIVNTLHLHICSTKCHPWYVHTFPGGGVLWFFDTLHLHICSTKCDRLYIPCLLSGYLIVLIPVTSTFAAQNVTGSGSSSMFPACGSGMWLF